MNVWPEVVKEAARIPELTVLAASDTAEIAGRFVEAFVSDPTRRWWWEAIRDDVPRQVVEYGEADGWDVLRERLPNRRFTLLVTDDQPIPAGAVSGSLHDLGTLVGECRYFEYVITDEAAAFGVFDTHHNALIRVGSLPL